MTIFPALGAELFVTHVFPQSICCLYRDFTNCDVVAGVAFCLLIGIDWPFVFRTDFVPFTLLPVVVAVVVDFFHSNCCL